MNQKLTAFMPAAVLLFGVLLVSGIREQYVTPPAQPMRALPVAFVGLDGRDMSITDDERKIAGMSDFMLRDFRSDSATKFTIFVSYYDRQVQGKTIHSPKNCLPGAGWEIMENKAVPLTAQADAPLGNRALLSNNGARALVFYWYQGRGRVEANEFKVKWDLLRDAAVYGRTEEALVRIVIPLPPVENGKPDVGLAAADSLAMQIAAPLVEAVYKVVPPLSRG